MKRFILSSIRIRSQASQIIDALINLDKLKQWWGVDGGIIEPKDGGIYCTTWLKSNHGVKFVSTGRIKLLDKNAYLHLEDMIYINSEKGILGPYDIQYDLESSETYCLLSVKQSGFKKLKSELWYYEAVEKGWPEALVMLKKYLENS